ncbi:DNA fragmentation factor subunit beta [Hypanus sabinus]|uniref:DNA fragmentation factor subunit beta n=1 Tax=Hypanus sabinus TaxID=79690 RepID=UPI0028C4EEFE|nr:DNA fragmentation factor subunit beta [Hypanus sabinus]
MSANPSKSFKVKSLNKDTKYGIVARNLDELLEKGCKKLQLPQNKCRVCLNEDGTEIDADYFLTLKDNCELIILEEGQEWKEAFLVSLDIVCNSLNSKDSEKLTRIANQELFGESSAKRRKFLRDYIILAGENTSAENRDEDANWFEGVESRFKTKSQYMRYNCAHRMRNYLREVKSHSKELAGDKGKMYDTFVKRIERHLKDKRFNEWYFDRKANANEGSPLCDSDGYFKCQGSFDKQSCEFFHCINPYSSRGNRIEFSTWNLDHRVEKKRVIIPDIVKAVENKDTNDNKVIEFYELLFTIKNLKLVDIFCHDKKKHNLSA